MSEKPESDEFEEEDAEDTAPVDDVDVDHIMRDVESQRRRAPKGAEPAWRRLERVMEERRTAELLSDFDDYEIGDADGADARGALGQRPSARKRKPAGLTTRILSTEEHLLRNASTELYGGELVAPTNVRSAAQMVIERVRAVGLGEIMVPVALRPRARAQRS